MEVQYIPAISPCCTENLKDLINEEGKASMHTWNLLIKGIAPASSGGMDIDRVVGVLQKGKGNAENKSYILQASQYNLKTKFFSSQIAILKIFFFKKKAIAII